MTALDCTFDDGIATLTFNNPPQNRLSTALSTALAAAVQDVAQRTDARVLLLNANGPDFSYGGDISAWPGMSAEQFNEALTQTLALANLFQDLPIPLVVAVQGYCGGGGFELALRGDIIIAADNAKFCHSEASIGVYTFLGGVQRVAERVGRTRATQWAFTAEQVDAHTAAEAGLVNEVTPLADLDQIAQAWAQRLRDGATLAHAAHKKIMRAWSNGGIEAADALLTGMAGQILHSSDTQECLPAAIAASQAGDSRPTFKFQGK
ncbi:MAG: enoyl-CoA hydratase/isomerase family protein [Pseudomonadota bacterium]